MNKKNMLRVIKIMLNIMIILSVSVGTVLCTYGSNNIIYPVQAAINATVKKSDIDKINNITTNIPTQDQMQAIIDASNNLYTVARRKPVTLDHPVLPKYGDHYDGSTILSVTVLDGAVTDNGGVMTGHKYADDKFTDFVRAYVAMVPTDIQRDLNKRGWKIVVVDSINSNIYGVQTNNGPNGTTVIRSKTIYIARCSHPYINATIQPDTTLHEIGHAVYYTYCNNIKMPKTNMDNFYLYGIVNIWNAYQYMIPGEFYANYFYNYICYPNTTAAQCQDYYTQYNQAIYSNFAK